MRGRTQKNQNKNANRIIFSRYIKYISVCILFCKKKPCKRAERFGTVDKEETCVHIKNANDARPR